MAGNARSDLVSGLRSRLSDDRASIPSFSLSVTGNCKSALLELTGSTLVVTVEGGENVQGVRLNLSDPRYGTVGRLISFFSRQAGYSATPSDESFVSDHPSTDLRVDGLPEISCKSSYTLRHRIFADEELYDFLSQAISLHNPNYPNPAAVPKTEYPYVYYKAAALAYRALAADTAKRRGLDAEASIYVSLAKDMEEQYNRDRRRQDRIIPEPKADESKMGAGDAVQGTVFRRSLRAGYNASYRTATPPTPPNLYDPADDDVEDVSVRLRWSQNREQSFSYYEVWRDTRPTVERSISGRLATSGNGSPQVPINTQYSRAGTSRQVLGAGSGANRLSPVFDGFFFWTAAELAGSNIVNATFIDGLIFNNPGSGLVDLLGEPLEPETDYYYRVYGINWNGEVVPSAVKKLRTRGMRARFKRTGALLTQNAVLASDALSVYGGPIAGGTSITVLGTDFSTGTRVQINGKDCPDVVIVSPTELTCESPMFVNTAFIGQNLDVVLVSPNGLVDIMQRGWTYA